VRGLWFLAALLGMSAATLTWLIGFPLAAVSYAASVPTTTLALLMGLGSYLLGHPRHRRWSWLLILFGLVVGPLVRGAWLYFLEGPLELGIVTLLCVLVAALTEPRDTRPSGDDPGS
jgi:drug/metabolite transporter (DMT)-like permease